VQLYYSSCYELKRPRKVVRIPNTDLAPFALCEFCKSMQTHGNGPQGPLITSLSKFRGPPEWCEVRHRVLYKLCNKCVSRARAPRGRDAWDALIDIKSDRMHRGIALECMVEVMITSIFLVPPFFVGERVTLRFFEW
jgi:hypothetical protein